jgi:hypothetical protein
MDAQLIPLQQFYLMAIAAKLQELKVDCIFQDLENGKTGRLFLISGNSTAALATLNFHFEMNGVLFEIDSRDERKLRAEIKYVEGIDGFIADMTKFLNANRLEHKRRAA